MDLAWPFLAAYFLDLLLGDHNGPIPSVSWAGSLNIGKGSGTGPGCFREAASGWR